MDEIITSLSQLRLPGSEALVSFKGFCVCKSGLWSRGEHKKELKGVGSEIVAPLYHHKGKGTLKELLHLCRHLGTVYESGVILATKQVTALLLL